MAYTTINKSTDYFNTKLYSGTGSSQNITGVGFQPDFIWAKKRNGAVDHGLFDAIRGVTKIISSNLANAETTASNTITAFGSDGFTTGGDNETGASGGTYVAWNWKANGAGSANTAGSINSTVSVNATSAFSIVKYTGTNSNATIGHGLGVAPKMIMIKNTSSSSPAFAWRVYHASLPITGANSLVLNGTNVAEAGYWNNTTPTANVFYVGANGETNQSSGTNIAYCFAEKTGYSKFGSYVGNGNVNGTFIYTGFAPAFFMLKRTDGTNSWRMWNNKIDPFNVRDTSINANEAGAEYTDASVYMDFVSNGVKFRTTGDNISGANYIYMAFAAAPLVGTNNVPANAR